MPTPSPTPLADVGRPGSVGADGSLPGGSVIGYRFARVAHAQVLTADSDTISQASPRIHLAGSADRLLSSTPTIAAGSVVGQELQLVNAGVNLVALQSYGRIDSTLKMRSRYVSLAPGCSITVVWDGTYWVELHRSTFGAPGELHVDDFGADPTGSADSWPAFVKMHDAFEPGVGSGANYRGGKCTASGKYKLSQRWDITKKLIFKGSGAGFQAGNVGTYLVFADGTAGIRCWASEAANPSSYNGSSAYSVWEDFQIGALGASSNAAHGFFTSAQVHVTRVMVGDFGGDGFRVEASTPDGNANSMSLVRCVAASNGGDGFHLIGSDANSVDLENCYSSHNGGWQYNLENYLPSFVTGCNAECETGLGTFRSSGGSNIWTRCYMEYGSNYGHAIHPSDKIDDCNFDFQEASPLLIIEDSGGGAHGTAIVNAISVGVIGSVLVTCRGQGYTNATTVRVYRGGGQGGDPAGDPGGAVLTPVIVDGEITGITVTNGGSGYPHWIGASSSQIDGSGSMRMTAFRVLQRSQGATCSVDLWLAGYSPNGAALLSASAADIYYPGEPDRFDQIAWNNRARCFETQFNHSETYSGIRHVHPLAVGQTGGRSTRLPTNSVMLVQGYWLGDGANARYRGIGTAAPTTGEWAKGDYIENSNTDSGNPRGWFCSANGTPGTWKPDSVFP